ncbi:ATP-binding protein [Alkalihalophilus pseudofirmus]|uniref:ATP-binding protein n=1 Tax=Alkalihalophilus pseudofirmus TaxID=79885 RepID=UPI0015888B60
MDESFNEIFFRARGYYAFKNETELNLLNQKLIEFESHLQQFAALDLTSEEQELYNNLVEFHGNYKENLLPEAIRLVENDDYEGLRSLASGGANQLVNQFVDFSQSFKYQTDQQLNKIFNDTLEQAQQFTILAFVISGLLFVIFIVSIWLLLLNLIRPVEKLTSATNAISQGKFVSINEVNSRNDELGTLAASFIHMAKSIQEKEEELTAQNEELTAQQIELQENQDRLQHSLTEVNSMTKALDKSAIVAITDKNGVITYVNDMFCEVTKYTKEEVIGKTHRLLKTSYHPNQFFDDMWDTIQGGGIWVDEVCNKAKDGSLFWLKSTIVPYLDYKGIPYQYIMIGNNITKTKEMQRELAASLEQAQETQLHLEQYNKLNHSLTFTLDKKEFITVIHNYLNELHKFDASIMYIPDVQLHVSNGLSKNSIKQMISSLSEDKIARLKKEKSFVIKREIESNYFSNNAYYCYDFYSAIRNKEGELVSLLLATREGHAFVEAELNQINGIMNRVSIAFERILMHENVEKARKLNQDIIDNVNEGIQFVSVDGSMIQVNEAFCDLLECRDFSRSDMNSKEKWMSYFLEKSSNKDEVFEFLKCSIEDEFKETRKFRYSIEKETTHFIEVYATSVYDGEEKIGTVLVHRDITKEHEVDQMKSELVSTVSHELRTPLSSVLGFTELLLTKQVKPERQKRYIETIHKEAKRLTNLINDFLDLQRMEAGKQQYHFKSIHMDKLTLDVVNRFRHEENHTIHLIDGARNVEVSADYERMVQVLMNLIGNAIKFSPNGGEVIIGLENVEEYVQIKIQDEGLGIPETELSKLFQKFKRLDNSARRKIGGTGLGLAISKEIISKHSGDIWIESEEGTGTTVYIKLPLLNNSINTTKHEVDLNRGLNVLIVEDDSSLALLLSEELKAKGYTVIHHTQPQDAFEDAIRLKVVGVVIDLMLGEDMNGWDLVEKLKENEKTKHVPIIISSALDRTDEKVKQYNVEKYLTKPYPPEELSKVIATFLKQESNNGTVTFPAQATEKNQTDFE